MTKIIQNTMQTENHVQSIADVHFRVMKYTYNDNPHAKNR